VPDFAHKHRVACPGLYAQNKQPS